MTDNKQLEAKIQLWNKKLEALKKEYERIMKLRGEAMLMGDLRENAAFQMADEDASTYQVRIDEVEAIIKKLELEMGGKAGK